MRANMLIKRHYCPTFKWKDQVPVPVELYPPPHFDDPDPITVDYYPNHDTFDMLGARGTFTKRFKDYKFKKLNSSAAAESERNIILNVNDIKAKSEGCHSMFGCDCYCNKRKHSQMNDVQQMLDWLEQSPRIIRRISDELLSNVIRKKIDLDEDDLKRLVFIRALARSHCLELKSTSEYSDKFDQFPSVPRSTANPTS